MGENDLIVKIMNMPLITIGIITFNAMDTVTDAIESALKQSWKPLEILIVDDSSIDGTWELLCCMANKNPELKIFQNKTNRGVAASRNKIIKEAKGEFIAFFDDDDISLPERVFSQYLRITNYENKYSKGSPVICHTARKIIYPNGRLLVEPTMGQIEEIKSPSGIEVALRILLGKPLVDGYGSCATCSQMARASTYKLVGCFDENLRRSEDTDLNIRLSRLGSHFVGISTPLVIQRMTKTQEKSLDEEERNSRLLIEKHRNMIEEYANFNFCELYCQVKYLWLRKKYIKFITKLIYLHVRYPILTSSRLYFAARNIQSNILFRNFHA